MKLLAHPARETITHVHLNFAGLICLLSVLTFYYCVTNVVRQVVLEKLMKFSAFGLIIKSLRELEWSLGRDCAIREACSVNSECF